MKRPQMSILRRLTCICFSLAIPLVAMAVGQPSNSAALPSKNETSPLIDKVRAATARFKDINVALREGWTVATPCVSGPDTGAMGVHLVMGSRLADGIISADEPEALIYEPRPGGAFAWVAVEYFETA